MTPQPTPKPPGPAVSGSQRFLRKYLDGQCCGDVDDAPEDVFTQFFGWEKKITYNPILRDHKGWLIIVNH